MKEITVEEILENKDNRISGSEDEFNVEATNIPSIQEALNEQKQ